MDHPNHYRDLHYIPTAGKVYKIDQSVRLAFHIKEAKLKGLKTTVQGF